MARSKLKAELAWNQVKSLNVGELLKKVKTLATQLAELNQDQISLDTLRPLAAQFATGELLQHKNKGVTAYAACCVADILRLSAPDAPFSQTQLKPVFECFIKQLKGLHDPEGPYYPQYYYLLESLATVESIVLVCDLPEKSEALVADFFEALFATIREDQRKNTEAHMISIMSQLVNEAPIVPESVITLLLDQFRQSEVSKKRTFSKARASREVAAAVMNNCADRLQRNVCQHFTEVICEAAKRENDADNKIESLHRVHDLVLELFRFAPTTLQNVIPQLESELNVENTECRIVATATINAMLSSLNGMLVLTQYPSTFKSWTSRRNDKSAQVRTTWVKGVGQILHSAPGASRITEVEKVCIDGLMTKFIDLDEKVRSAACEVVGEMPYSVAKERLTAAVLAQFAIRCRDKKHATQAVGFSTISKLLHSALPDIAGGSRLAKDKFGPLVNDLLHCMYINDLEVSAMLEEGLLDSVLDVVNDDDHSRCLRLMEMVSLADDRARKALFVIIGTRQLRNSQLLFKYIQICDKYNGGVMEKNREQILMLQSQVHNALAAQFADSHAAAEDLLQFARLNDRRYYKLIHVCIDPSSDHRAICKAYCEFKSRIGKTSSRMAATMITILRRSAFLVLNRSIMPGIYTAATSRASYHALAAQELLKVITNSHSSIYRAYLEPIIEDIKAEGVSTALDNLRAFAKFARSNEDALPEDPDFAKVLKRIVLEGPVAHVKQAVTILCSMQSRDVVAIDLSQIIMSNLVYGEDNLLQSLSALAQLSLMAAQPIEKWANDISAFCLKELLLKSRTQVDDDADQEWVGDDALEDECKAKCLAIKILGNRLRAFNAAETAAEIARPVFKALRSIVDNAGEVVPDSNTPRHHRSRIRLEAARMIIKLAQFPVYEKLLGARDFNSFALFAQDLEYHVRTAFLNRLQKSLVAGKLSPRFHVILFLAAHDPDVALQHQATQWAKNIAHNHRNQEYLMESMLPRLVHLLAHHPDFAVDDRDDSDLLNFAVYFSFYFDAIVTEESLTLVYHYAQRLKQVADAISEDNSEVGTLFLSDVANLQGLHILSDVAEAVFAAKAEHNSWPLHAYPKKLKLPTDLFCALRSTVEAAKTQTNSFISGELRDAIRNKVARLTRPRMATSSHQTATLSSPAKVAKINKRSTQVEAKTEAKVSKRHKPALPGTLAASAGRRTSGRVKASVAYAESDRKESDLLSAASD
ncbi:hypothetical protein BCR37DRAFT_378936 [Protomyces lactucae-debilis]|uniref:Armadillo-type protein n=1 Tax=Protomyces lactucae-debilis TaxID=2754530 RepID=A0A1Y2FIZ6_PROLT|nr:uncharacterized protein BCR37DRAFT_378936 [Protomyces lactucae-debilis]ORY83920.1 hypothetical protein BCR37DRAFT_378936 [Protomyces lactucae-debilis]